MKKQLFSGSCVRLAVPLAEGGTPDHDALDALLDRQLEAGTDAVLLGFGVLAGSAGRRLDLLEHIVMRVNRRMTVLAEVGGDAEGACLYARDAGIRGADGLVLAAPEGPAAEPSALAAHFAKVADAAGLPAILRCDTAGKAVLSADDYRVLAGHPLLLAELVEHDDYTLLTEAASACRGDFTFFAGQEGVILPVLALGGGGAVSRLGNLFPQDLRDLCHLYFMGRLQDALAVQFQLVPHLAATRGMDDRALLDYGRGLGLK